MNSWKSLEISFIKDGFVGIFAFSHMIAPREKRPAEG